MKHTTYTTNYPVGDFLIRLKNATLARQKSFAVPVSKFIKSIVKTLIREGFLDGVRQEGGFLVIDISYRKKEPVITDIKLISKPGLRVYMSRSKIERHKGPEVLIISTSKGVLTLREAIKKGLGGEVIAEIL